MNHCVPDFDMDEDYSIPTSSALTPPRKPSMPDDEIMELLWHNGQVVMQSQNQRSFKKSPPSRFQDPAPAPKEIRPAHPPPFADHLFMQEDEMVSWLHYDPPFEHDFCADLLYPSPSVTTTASAPPVRPTTEPRPPLRTSAVASASSPHVPPIRRAGMETPRVHSFLHFGRPKPTVLQQQSGPSNSKSVVRESTVVDSSDTPTGPHESRASQGKHIYSETASGWNHQSGGETMTATAGCHGTSSRDIPATTCEMTSTSSPGGSSASAELATHTKAVSADEDRKRKGRGSEETDCPSEDVDFEFGGGKKQSHGSSAKRSRAAEVHNLSERRRRDRINEKMKALQELIPRCNKSDKASMLDEAIEYLKSLQMQVQMMSMGCGMVPMMFPGIQQYMPSMGMGLGMGMGMGMDMNSMSRPMMPFPNVLAGASLATPAAAHLAPRFPVQAFAMQPPVPGADPSRIRQNTQADAMLNTFGMQAAANLPRGPHFPDPYQQYIGLQPMQLQPPQNQQVAQQGSSRPGTGRTSEGFDNRPSDKL